MLLAWSEYIQDRECMHVNAKAVRNLEENVTDSPLCDFPYTGQKAADATATPTKLLAFVTEAQLPPSMGQPSIGFTAHGTLPTTSTRSCTAQVPPLSATTPKCQP